MKIYFVFAGIVLMFGSGVVARFAPIFLYPGYNFVINQNIEKSTVIGRVNAYTADGEPVSYSVSDDMTAFDVDKNTGYITVAQSLQPDVKSYEFEVVATTKQGLKGTTRVLINVYSYE